MRINIACSFTLLFTIQIFCGKPLFAAEALIALPEHLSTPFSNIKNRRNLSSASELEVLFRDSNYVLEQVRNSLTTPRLYVINLPPDLKQLTVANKTSLFIRLLLTSVIKVNSDILAARTQLIALAEKSNRGQALSANEQHWLTKIAHEYTGSPDNLPDLLARVDILPVALVMAQAIDESGWGTSRFAIEGNALYGQHLPKNSNASYLSTTHGNIRVASFNNIYHSTASYTHNLNTTRAYTKLRSVRANIRRTQGILTGAQLADSLLDYSERGQHYVDTLKWLITHYQLDQLEKVKTDSDGLSTLIGFER